MKLELSAFRRIYKRRLIVTLLVAIAYLITSLISLGLAVAGAQSLPMIGLTGSTLMCSLLPASSIFISVCKVCIFFFPKHFFIILA